MRRIRTAALSAALVLFGGAGAMAAPHCYTSYGGVKPNKLYLYFPPAADTTYPDIGTPNGGPPTSPAHAFNVADLPSYSGTAAALESAIYDVVADDYCEFNVEVISTTTPPPTTFARRDTVAIGTEDGNAYGGLFGMAQSVDTGDTLPIDFAYEWGATYQSLYGGAGGALNGTNSTTDRWAYALGGTAAHEAGHNYGLSHNDGLPVGIGEDPLVHHLMASGSHYSGTDRAGYRRHFSDHEYSVLASNVGLSVQTIWNWDFVNPNAQTAVKLRMDILSTQASLTVNGPYNGNESPWINPTVSASLGTQTFKGINYNQFQVTWTAGHSWDGHVPGGPGPGSGVSGQVSGGASFHVGTGFTGVNYNTVDPVIITNVTLFDTSNTALALHPRGVAFDSGVLDTATGTLDINAMNVAGPPMRLDMVSVQLLPRLLSIDSMVVGSKRILDVRGIPFRPWGEARVEKIGRVLEKGSSFSIPIAKLSDKRHIVERVDADCEKGDRLQGPDTGPCKAGYNVDLFPATTTLLEATTTELNARYWNPEAKRYVVGPLTTHAFLQVVGRHPDLNKNGVDDYIDILTGRLQDRNHNGRPHEIKTR